jgi:sphinganine-1-phosphate aldolase
MYRHPAIRKYQYFLCADWTGGIYASPSVAGSRYVVDAYIILLCLSLTFLLILRPPIFRPGALIAGCWAALMTIGEAGYLETCKKIIGARREIQAG